MLFRKFKRTKKPNEINLHARTKFIFVSLLVVTVIFLLRLFSLQVIGGDDYRAQAYAQRRTKKIAQAERGAIYDRNQEPLAISVNITSAYLSPKQVDPGDYQEVADTLSYILGLEPAKVMDSLHSKKDYIRIKDKVSDGEIQALTASGIRAVSLEHESQRFYPNDSLLSQTLGYTNDEGLGIYGAEKEFDQVLRGSAGQDVFTKDLRGRVVPTEEGKSFDPSNGQSICLTIDLEAQKILREEMAKCVQKYDPKSITGIISNPNTGEILAMESLPNFNPNQPRQPEETEDRVRWDSMTEEDKLNLLYERWKNPAVSGLYEPGSVFKSITTALALDSQALSKDTDHVLCQGSIQIAPQTRISCDRGRAHGEELLKDALVNSCNSGFVQIVWKIGPQRFTSYLRALHMGGKSGIDLPAEASSVIPKTLSAMDQARFATMSYGHGLSVTPLQILTMANTTINGGYYIQPHIFYQSMNSDKTLLSSYQVEKGDPIFSQDTVKTMRDYLQASACKPFKELQGKPVGGKSGTTVIAKDGVYTRDTVASYFAFYPADDPKLSILIVVNTPNNQGYGSLIAVPVASQTLTRYVERGEKEGEKGPSDGKALPDFVGKTVEEAEKTGYPFTRYGSMSDFSVIGSQMPKAGGLYREGQTITLYPDDRASYLVPDMTGASKKEVEDTFQATSIPFDTRGEGKVVDQDPKPGTKVPGTTRIRFILDKEKEGN